MTTVKCKCDDQIHKADEKLKINSEKLGLFITINTFLGGLLLFGVQREKRDVNTKPYMTDEKRIIQLQLLDFCIFLGAIMSAFIFITLTNFRSFDSTKGCFNNKAGCCVRYFTTLTDDQKELYDEDPSPVYDKSDNDHIALYKAAKKEDRLRDSFRKTSMLITFVLTMIAIILLVIGVFKGAHYQLDQTFEDEKDVTGLDNWVLPLCTTFVIAPPVVALILVWSFTGRLYDIIGDRVLNSIE